MLLGPRSKAACIWPKIASHAGYTFARDVLGEMLKRATCALCMVALHGSVPHRRCRVRLLLCRRCCVDLDALMLPHSLHSLPRSPRSLALARAGHGRIRHGRRPSSLPPLLLPPPTSLGPTSRRTSSSLPHLAFRAPRRGRSPPLPPPSPDRAARSHQRMWLCHHRPS